jgi:hypothetical protein
MQTHALTFSVDPIAFEIKNLLNGERCFGRSAPSGRSGPTKYHRLAFRNSLHRIGTTSFPIINFLFGRRPAPKGRWPPL